MTFCQRLYEFFLLLLLGSVAHAQPLPDAGNVQQQLKPDQLRSLPAVEREPQATPKEIYSEGNETVTVSRFEFTGNTQISDQELAAAVAEYLNHPITFSELKQVPGIISKVYSNQGWLVQAFLPPQDITEGAVLIQIVEAVLGVVLVEKSTESRIDSLPSKLSPWFKTRQKPGDQVSVAAIERALLLTNDLPGISVAGSFTASQNENSTDLILTPRTQSLINADVGIDNYGQRSTGRERLRASLLFNSPFTLGDQLSLSVLHSEGLDYGSLGYRIPLGTDGWQLATTASYFQYDVIDQTFSLLDLNGESAALRVDLSYPLIRSSERNLSFILDGNHRWYRNKSLNTTLSDFRLYSLRGSLLGNAIDDFAGGGLNKFRLAITAGKVSQGDPDPAENTSMNGGYYKIGYQFGREQFLRPALSAFADVRGQFGEHDLDNSERFYLGGPSGIRAYPTSEGSGDSGHIVSLGINYSLPHNFTLTGFYDWGHVNNSGQQRDFSLRGGGFSVGWLHRSGIELTATWSRRSGTNPNRTEAGLDQDGSLLENRFWLSLHWRYQ